jgi:dihydrodipicolinate synthase/N-acetylneuraminate lyase
MTFTGVIPALLTPFDADLRVVPDSLTDNTRALLDAGIEHVVVCGTMGEAGALDTAERGAVIETALATRATVTVGVSSADAATAAAHAEQAAALGAHGVMCTPPTTYEATDPELEAFFATVTSATDLPLMLYNNPQGARNDLQPEQIARLAAGNERIVAVKECSGDARRIAHVLELCGDRLEVLVGGDDWALEGYAAGAAGWVSGVANVAPAECLALERRVHEGDLAAARSLWPRLAPLARLDMDARLVQSFKAALELTGHHGGPTRPPRLALDEQGLEGVRAAVAQLQGVTA